MKKGVCSKCGSPKYRGKQCGWCGDGFAYGLVERATSVVTGLPRVESSKTRVIVDGNARFPHIHRFRWIAWNSWCYPDDRVEGLDYSTSAYWCRCGKTVVFWDDGPITRKLPVNARAVVEGDPGHDHIYKRDERGEWDSSLGSDFTTHGEPCPQATFEKATYRDRWVCPCGRIVVTSVGGLL